MTAKTYLVTGSAGFIGSNYVLGLFEKHSDITVVSVDALTYAGSLDNLASVLENPRHVFVREDIRNRSAMCNLVERYAPDVIVNFAAESHVDRSIKNPVAFADTNTAGTVSMLDAALEGWQSLPGGFEGRRFIQISTDEVYGSLGLGETRAFVETDQLNPRSPYSASKGSADLFAHSYNVTYGLPVLITRCTNNYGPRQYAEKLIPVVIAHALGHKPVPLYGDGKHVRDWLHVSDHCAAIDAVIERGRIGEVYNIGANNEQSNIDIVKRIISICARLCDDDGINESLIEFVEDRKGHDRRYSMDASKIRRELGWQPQISFDDGIEETVRWYVTHYADAWRTGCGADVE